MYVSHLFPILGFSAETEHVFPLPGPLQSPQCLLQLLLLSFFQLFKGISIPFSGGQSCGLKKALSNNRKAVIVHTALGKDMHELPELMKS